MLIEDAVSVCNAASSIKQDDPVMHILGSISAGLPDRGSSGLNRQK